MDALTAGWLVPIGVGLQFVHCDPANYFEAAGRPARPHQLLRAERVPHDVDVGQAFSDSVVNNVNSIDEATIHRAVARGLEEPAPPGLVTSLSELWWTGVRARSPVSDEIELAAPLPTSTVSEIINGARWYFGPTVHGQAGPPASLRATNSHFTTELLLEIYWDLWVGYPAGRALVDAGIASVLARSGWEYQQVFPRQ